MATIQVTDKKDLTWGRIAGVLTVIVLFLICRFFVWEEADPKPEIVPLPTVMAETIELKELVVVKEAGGSTGAKGEAANDPVVVKEVVKQRQEVITDKSPTNTNTVTQSSGKSNKDNTNQNSDNTASTTTPTATNPFGKGGTGGGRGAGSSDVFGPDSGKEGSGSGTSSGNGKARVRYNEISTSGIVVSNEVQVRLILTVNEDGQVVAARTVGAGTTTNDQRVINQVIAACKAQLRYEKRPGGGYTEEYYTALIKPN